MPKLSRPPATVPTSLSSGRSGSATLGGGGGGTYGAAATAGGGGRRDWEKIGRSRVTERFFSGIAHSGLPLRIFAAALRGGVPGTSLGAAGAVAGAVVSLVMLQVGLVSIGSVRTVGAAANTAAVQVMTKPTINPMREL